MKEKLLSVTAKDCEWQYFKASGAGGQARNKTSSAARCIHKASGARGECSESRSQHDNKSKAFERMAQSKEFKHWLRIESARALGLFTEIEAAVARSTTSDKLRLEVRDDRGRWTEVGDDYELS